MTGQTALSPSGRASPPDWSRDLVAGEQLLWVGRPLQGRRYGLRDFGKALLGVMAALFALAWCGFIVTLLRDPLPPTQPALYWMLLAFCGFTVLLSLCAAYWLLWHDWFRRERDLENSFYALTDQRALKRLFRPASRAAHSRLDSWPIRPGTAVELIPDPRHNTASLHLARRAVVDGDGDTSYIPTGFDRLADAEHVLQLILEVQAKATEANRTQARSQPDTDPG